MNKPKCCGVSELDENDKSYNDVADYIERGLQSLCKGNVTLEDRNRAEDLYKKLIIGRKPKEAVSYVLWEMAACKGKGMYQAWASAIRFAYARKSKKGKK